MSLMGTSDSSPDLSDLEALAQMFDEDVSISVELDVDEIDPFVLLYQQVLTSTDPLLWEAFIKNTESMSLLTKVHYEALLCKLQQLIQASKPLHKPWLTLFAIYAVKAHPTDFAVVLGKHSRPIAQLLEIASQKIQIHSQTSAQEDNIQIIKWLNFMLAFQSVPKGLPLLLNQPMFKQPLPFALDILGPHLLFQILKHFPEQYTDVAMQHIRSQIEQYGYVVDIGSNIINPSHRRLVSILRLLHSEPNFDKLIHQDPSCMRFLRTFDLDAPSQKTPSTLLEELEQANALVASNADNEVSTQVNHEKSKDKAPVTEAVVSSGEQSTEDDDVKILLIDDSETLQLSDQSSYNEATPLLNRAAYLENPSRTYHPAMQFFQRLFLPCFQGCFKQKNTSETEMVDLKRAYKRAF